MPKPSLQTSHTPHPRRATSQRHGWRNHLAANEAMLALAATAMVVGLLTGAVAMAFRLAVELPLEQWFGVGRAERFEQLSPLWRFGLPVGGAILLALLWQPLRARHRATGVAHVLDRTYNHAGRLPFANACAQFGGGVLALVSGQSMGREGPAVHLGAAFASLFGRRLNLPGNSRRTLIGCGVAAAIAASFNTPLTAVVFAMEVVLLEYTVAGFLPVILAAVTGAALAQWVYGSAPLFNVPALQLASFAELGLLAAGGVLIGLLAAAQLRLFARLRASAVGWLSGFSERPVAVRFITAGLLTGSVAVVVPEVMGVGYDTVQLALLGQLGGAALLTIALAKALTFIVSAAAGLPAGSVGPAVVIGAAAGAALGGVATALLPGAHSDVALYATAGIAAMFAALINAPLAGLLAVVELTGNPALLTAAMAMVATATLTARFSSGLPGIFAVGLAGGNYHSARFRALSRVSVLGAMNRNIAVFDQPQLGAEATAALLRRHPAYLLLRRPGEPTVAMSAAALAPLQERGNEVELDWQRLPGELLSTAPIDATATLNEALEAMDRAATDWLFVAQSAPNKSAQQRAEVVGLLSRAMIARHY
jgi:CIC family chloride channel protein